MTRYMPAMRMRCDTRRAHSSRWEKCAPTRSTPVPFLRQASRCSRPSIAHGTRASARSDPIQASANSTNIKPRSRSVARNSAARSSATSCGMHNSRLRCATWRRSPGRCAVSATEGAAQREQRAIRQARDQPDHAECQATTASNAATAAGGRREWRRRGSVRSAMAGDAAIRTRCGARARRRAQAQQRCFDGFCAVTGE